MRKNHLLGKKENNQVLKKKGIYAATILFAITRQPRAERSDILQAGWIKSSRDIHSWKRQLSRSRIFL